MRKDSIGIMVAAHFDCSIPGDSMYIPIMAGSSIRDSVPDMFIRDDSGENISDKNESFCELTALYWGWKNLSKDAVGLCHYRRLFASLANKTQILREDEVMHLLRYYDVILPMARNYIIESNHSQYVHSHHAADLALTRSIIEERCPEYLDSYDRRMAMTTGHRFNMFIMRKALLDDYCCWLFDLLFELERRLDVSQYTGNDRRVFGLVSERLLDVWIDAHGLRTTDIDYIFIGRERVVHKAAAMIARKLKYFVSTTYRR